MTPSLDQFQSDTERLRREALQAFEHAATPADLETARIQFIGDRSGQLKAIQQALGALPKEDKVVVEGIALYKRHLKGSPGKIGRIIERPRPVHVSNVARVEK